MDLLVVLLVVICYESFRIVKYGVIEDRAVSIVEDSGDVTVTDVSSIPIGKNFSSKKEFHAFEKILKEFGL